MNIITLKECRDELVSNSVILQQVVESGQLSRATYHLLGRIFNPDVLDTERTFEAQFTSPGVSNEDTSPYVAAALIKSGDSDVIAGCVCATYMNVSSTEAILAIGYICRELELPKVFSGIGSRLLNKAIEASTELALKQNRRLIYTVAEAEDRSLNWWKRMKFGSPMHVKNPEKKILYFTPPLDFDQQGIPAYEEVRENLLLCPTGDCRTISATTLKSIVRCIYENWFIAPWQGEIPPEGMAAVQRKVEDVYEGFTSSILEEELVLSENY